MGGYKLRGRCDFTGMAPGFLGWLVFLVCLCCVLAVFCAFLFLLVVPLCIPPAYFWGPCSLLLNILLLLIKKKKVVYEITSTIKVENPRSHGHSLQLTLDLLYVLSFDLSLEK